MSGENPKERVFEVLQSVAEQLDNVTPKEREQIMTMLYARYELKVVKVSATPARRPSYRSGLNSKPRRW